MNKKAIIAYALGIALILTPGKVNNAEYRYFPPSKTKIAAPEDSEDDEKKKEDTLIRSLFQKDTRYTRQQHK